MAFSLADLRGRWGRTPAPTGQLLEKILANTGQLLEKILANNRSGAIASPIWKILDPPLVLISVPFEIVGFVINEVSWDLTFVSLLKVFHF